MKIDEYLSERLTNDKTADAVEENYRGLMEIEGIERDPMQESYIKLNRLERKEEPMKVRKGDFNYLYCPACGNRFETWVQLDPYCSKCGQRLQL